MGLRCGTANIVVTCRSNLKVSSVTAPASREFSPPRTDSSSSSSVLLLLFLFLSPIFRFDRWSALSLNFLHGSYVNFVVLRILFSFIKLVLYCMTLNLSFNWNWIFRSLYNVLFPRIAVKSHLRRLTVRIFTCGIIMLWKF